MGSPSSPIDLGAAIQDVASEAARRINRLPIIESIRNKTITRERYAAFVASLYPVVIGFNRALIHSLTKIDHVRNSSHLKDMADQLREEQQHNQMWRAMLSVHRVNHESLYNDLLAYINRIEIDELSARTNRFLQCLRGSHVVNDQMFRDAPVPGATVAIYHFMWLVAVSPEFGYWEHYASQLAMEIVICDVVTRSILPGTTDRAELAPCDEAVAWWAAHALPAATGFSQSRSDEEKHILIGTRTLSRLGSADTMQAAVLDTSKNKLALFERAIRESGELSGEEMLSRYRVEIQ